VKLIAGGAEDPAEVHAAAAARGDLPAEAGEPRERRLRITDVGQAGGQREAADDVDEAAGVDERVLVAVDRDAVSW
jgi:hypothetical protein